MDNVMKSFLVKIKGEVERRGGAWIIPSACSKLHKGYCLVALHNISLVLTATMVDCVNLDSGEREVLDLQDLGLTSIGIIYQCFVTDARQHLKYWRKYVEINQN